ncbi:hypothetical protein CHS0354_019310 [Potamilus streckersoni]|uniref:G-protein coupled receptors family 1 profile domain-containing protein n=1 Tax=Potamilus streckersoni TaxID=2493646 RepID=A0AAE0SHY1_9BIVA|nr:hypothetical protein CHS0354_019310 [Potamilus streckersoni]
MEPVLILTNTESTSKEKEENTVAQMSFGNLSVNISLLGNATTTNTTKTIFLPWDNPSNVISKELAVEITFFLECLIFPILTISGLTGNVISLVILLQSKMRTPTGICLTSLTISDSLFLVTNMMRKSTCIIDRFNTLVSNNFNATSFAALFYLKLSFSRITTWITVLISVERLIAVIFPLKAKIWITKRRMLAASIFIYVTTLASISPIAAQYKVDYFYDQKLKAESAYIATSDFYNNNKDGLKIHNEYFLTIVFRYIPMLLMIILNAGIAITLGRGRRWRNTMQLSSNNEQRVREEKRVTIMLLVVAVIFLLCLTPGDVLLIVSDIIKGFRFLGTQHNIFLVLSDVSLLFEIFNSSVNFIIYMAWNKQFNAIYRKLFCKCIKRNTRSGKVTKAREMSESSMSNKTAAKSAIATTQASLTEEEKDKRYETDQNISRGSDMNEISCSNKAFVKEESEE